MSGRLKALLVLAAILGYAAYSAGENNQKRDNSLQKEETFRLVHAIGNTESVSAKNLSKPECEARKRELKAAATALGTYNESADYGSITCLPDSLFEN